MDAVEFLKQYSRMVTSGVQPFAVPSKLAYEEIVDSVEQWAKEHPVKTRQSEFLKMFPNAALYNEALVICPCCVDTETYKNKDDSNCIYMDGAVRCKDCKHDFWLKEID